MSYERMSELEEVYTSASGLEGTGQQQGGRGWGGHSGSVVKLHRTFGQMTYGAQGTDLKKKKNVIQIYILNSTSFREHSKKQRRLHIKMLYVK